jgi:hypothetical protein
MCHAANPILLFRRWLFLIVVRGFAGFVTLNITRRQPPVVTVLSLLSLGPTGIQGDKVGEVANPRLHRCGVTAPLPPPSKRSYENRLSTRPIAFL